ncbi:unnamed protein product [Rodentolepis nana]|uniref:CTP_transf_like domain-containing protein n=1 Tax=Rodentolepis nana TaxID=102285 RepID=A0A0R3U0C2_RODNA|nr:unnamed protein product [Rodentolepis nana]
MSYWLLKAFRISLPKHSGSATNAWLSAHLCAVREVMRKVDGGRSCLCRCGKKRKNSPSDALTDFPSIRVKMVCGADLLESFATPNLWSDEDMTALVRDYGIVCISRPGSDASRLLNEMDILSQYEVGSHLFSLSLSFMLIPLSNSLCFEIWPRDCPGFYNPFWNL